MVAGLSITNIFTDTCSLCCCSLDFLYVMMKKYVIPINDPVTPNRTNGMEAFQILTFNYSIS